MTAKLLGLAAGLILLAVVWWVARQLGKDNGGHHEAPASGWSDPVPRDPPRPQ